jgi:transcriptional regulator with PAS, ATPase and Fis domain
MPAPSPDEGDTTFALDGARKPLEVQRIRLIVSEGPDRGKEHVSTSARVSIGSHELNELTLNDASVSRFHCEIVIDSRVPRLRDLESRNGTFVDGLEVRDVYLREGSQIRLGTSAIRFTATSESSPVALSERSEFGSLVGSSTPMRRAFALLERAAASESTVLLEGETGTGKEGAAAAIHEASARSNGPFVVVDCGSLPAELLESELFGHEKGAFTGAHQTRRGAFADASGGSVFLDEIGELSPEIQPKLLRVLDSHTIRRVGANVHEPVDVRVIAATNRDLRSAVNSGRFRADLYYRLAVLRIRLPPLRERPEDIDLLVPRLLARLNANPSAQARLSAPALVSELKALPWPGNVRELKNYVERSLAFDPAEPAVESAPGSAPRTVVPYEQARKQKLDEWERGYAILVLRAAQGHVERAAKLAGISRASMYRLVSRHGLRAKA